ncbi:serine/threonine-protein kinase [Nocardiopsis aegyptia]|uniref:serine/threonine-protein kinase n=1 Tax=Nocardiopsis aegyptia TaxID=220378 RepID=UPI00366B3B16
MADPLRDGDPTRIGPYQLHARLGGGGMGRVFLGNSPGGRLVAVKVVRPELVDDADFRRRFADEVRAARKVGGFYTAHIVDADTDVDPPWMATAYISGPSLHQAVHQHGPLPPESVAVLGAGLAEALLAVHDQKLVHRDLKPDNVILAEDGPRLIDFGIARATDSPTYTAAQPVIGTIGFMSPEQACGSEVAPPSDVFALGCVLAFAATGRNPFGEGPIHAVLYRIVHEEPDLSALPEPLAGLVGACLAKDPDARPGLNRLLGDLATLVPSGRVHGEGRWLPEEVTEVITLRKTQVLEHVPPRELPGSEDAGTGLAVPRPRRPAVRTASAVMALLCLPTVLSVPFTIVQAITIGAMWDGELLLHTALCAIQAAVLAIGALLLLAQNTAGRWLIAIGGTGLALQAGILAGSLLFQSADLDNPAPLGVLVLTSLTAAASVLLALLPSAESRHRRAR